MKEQLISKFISKEATIGIVGLGYVGLPLLLSFANSGFRVLGLDIDPQKIIKLQSGESYLKQITAQQVAEVLKADLFVGTTDFSRAGEADALIICVPTPLNKYQEPDLSYVINTIEALLPYLHAGQVISLESTTYPGTTAEEVWPRLASTGLELGKEIHLVYSPERVDPGNETFAISAIPKLCSGITDPCREVGLTLYSQVFKKVVPVSSTRVAEMAKLLENIHRAVNIGLVNELKILADVMDIDIYEVIDAAATKPFGFTPYYPGPGLGGHCIPIDPFYLTWKAREYGLNTRFIELAGEINRSMPGWVVAKITDALNEIGLSVNGSKILILGIAYKKNIDDIRESPGVVLIERLTKKGAKIDYYDPYIPVFPKMRQFQFNLQSINLTPDKLAQYDCVVIATDHDILDYKLIKNFSSLIVDTRGVYRELFPGLVRA